MKYDKNNIFAKILRGEIPCKKVYENEYVLSFHDINPQKKIHILVIPKGEFIDLDDLVCFMFDFFQIMCQLLPYGCVARAYGCTLGACRCATDAYAYIRMHTDAY